MKKLIYLILSLLFIAPIFSTAQIPEATFQFHDGLLYDNSGNEYHLKSYRNVSPTQGHIGAANSGLLFDGGYCAIKDVQALGFVDQAITISLWLNLPSYSSTWIPLINKWGGFDVGGYYLGIRPESNEVLFNAFVDSVADTSAVPTMEWFHIAATYDGDTIKMYRNGSLTNQSIAAGSIANGGGVPFMIGCQSNSFHGGTFMGAMDEIFLFNEALNEEEINQLYTNGYINQQVDLVAVSTNTPKEVVVTDSLQIKCTFQNTGMDTISSFNLFWANGTDTSSQSLTNLNLAPDQLLELSVPSFFPITVGEQLQLEIWAESPNGIPDASPENNHITSNHLGALFIPEKIVQAETTVGTWADRSPIGYESMDYMIENYPDQFIGIHLHYDDPMEIFDYALTNIPLTRIDHENNTFYPYPFVLEYHALNRLDEFTPADIEAVVQFDTLTREIMVELSSTFAIPQEGAFRFNLYVIENGITGTGSDYNQANYFANEDDFWSFLDAQSQPDPIPASQMVYNRVTRAVLGGNIGTEESLPPLVEVGQMNTYNYSYTLPQEFDAQNIDLVGVVQEVSPLKILNGIRIPLSEATIITSTEEPSDNNNFNVFPNPVADRLNVQINYNESRSAQLLIRSIMGKILLQQTCDLSQASTYNIDVSSLPAGTYLCQISTAGQVKTKSFIKVRK